MTEVIIHFERYVEEDTNDPAEAELARNLGPLVTDRMGKRVRVQTGSVVDDVTYRLMGGFKANLKRPLPAELPAAVEREIADILGRAYAFNFKNKAEDRAKMKALLERESWKSVKQRWLDYIRKDKMRPLSALYTILAPPADAAPAAPTGHMSDEDARKMGL